MPNARIQTTVANAGVRGTIPAARTSSDLSRARAVSPFVNSRISESNVTTVVTTTVMTGGGIPIGLLLALTYASTSTSTAVTSPGGYGPHAYIR